LQIAPSDIASLHIEVSSDPHLAPKPAKESWQMARLGVPRIPKREDRVPEDLLQSPPENDVYLHLMDVKEGVFSKYDWIFLNDRILFVNMTGIGTFVSKNIKMSYSQILGGSTATKLITRLKELRRKKVCTISDQDIVNMLSVDQKNAEMLYADMEEVRLEKRFLRGYRLIVSSKSTTRKADVPWNKVSYKKLILFFKARVGSRFYDK
jgi:hypothetical protein